MIRRHFFFISTKVSFCSQQAQSFQQAFDFKLYIKQVANRYEDLFTHDVTRFHDLIRKKIDGSTHFNSIDR